MATIKPSTAFKAGADWVSAEVRSYMTDQVATHVDIVQDVRDNDFERTRFLYVRTKAALYRLNLSSGAADDGDTVIRDNMGRRYEKVAGTGSTVVPWDAQVDDLSARDAYDDEDEGFVVLVSDNGDGRAAIYTMGDGGSADWIGPAYVTGPEGTAGQGAVIEYTALLARNDGIVPAIYAVERSATANQTLADLYVELLDADPGTEMDLYLAVDGTPAYGPFTVAVGSPEVITSLSVEALEGDAIDWVVTAVTGGEVREAWARATGALTP